MARNAIKSDIFGHPKMTEGGYFVEKIKLRIALKWREIRSNLYCMHPKGHIVKKFQIDLK